MSDYASQRQQMVEQQLIPRGIGDPATLEAMREVPRHVFAPEELREYAYQDGPLPIGEGQTISQPYIVALMTQAAEVESSDIVLEIGTGSGYGAAVLAHIAKEVYTIERFASLMKQAVSCFQELGYTNIHARVGDGSLGWPQEAPFDAILVTAGAPEPPPSLQQQLKVGGRLVIPVGDALGQELLCYRKISEDQLSREWLEFVRFVPLVGQEGWFY